MDDPTTEIPTAINRCAGALSPDAQITAFEHYFTPDSSFLHPLCYVPSGHDSRRRIIGIYLFYRGIIPKTSFEIQHVALDERTLHLYVGLIQRPEVLLMRTFFVPAVPMHIHFHLRKVGGKYYIDSQEDLIQARVIQLPNLRPSMRRPMLTTTQSLLMAVPVVRWYGAAFYFFCEVMGLLTAYLFMAVGIWKPVEHINKHLKLKSESY